MPRRDRDGRPDEGRRRPARGAEFEHERRCVHGRGRRHREAGLRESLDDLR